MTEIAKLYGGSLYGLAAEEGLTADMMQQMTEIRALFRENPDYIRLLSEPSLPKKERTDLIEKAFDGQAERYLINFLKILCERGSLNEFGGCCDEFKRRYNEDNNIAEAVVTSAVRLDEDQVRALTEKLEKMSGKKISLTLKTDPALVAGLRVELSGKLLDGSAKSRLTGISRELNELVV